MPLKTTPIPEFTEKEKSRFWDKVEVLEEDECWEWKAGKNKKGYGQIKICGKMYGAHRVAWFLKSGPIPRGLFVLHKCDNPPCENPKHLFLGTNKDNILDASKKGKIASGDRHGSKTHPEKISHPNGEKNGNSNLTNLIVLEMRKRYSEGELQANIAKNLEVSQVQVSRIVNRKRWTHV